MGWFDEQIRLRKQSDQEAFDDAFVHAAGAILGHRYASAMNDDWIVTKNVIEEILKYYHKKAAPLPEGIKDFEESLDYLLRPHGIMRRRVVLKPGWTREAFGPMIGVLKESQTPVALLPWGLNGYAYTDPLTGKRCPIHKKEEALLEKEALCFYHPLPQRKIGTVELFQYMASCFSPRDGILLLLLMFVTTLMGMVVPMITRTLMGPVLRSKTPSLLVSISIFFVCVTISVQLMSLYQSLISDRFTKKMDLQVEAAAMMRVLSMPTGFFRNYNAGELSSRMDSLNRLCDLLLNTVLGSSLSSLFSLMYLGQISGYAPSLVLPSLMVIFATLGFSTATSLLQMKISEREMELTASNTGMSYALLGGVQKIRLAGAEKRVFARWLHGYAGEAALRYSPPLMLKLQNILLETISMAGTIFFYYYACKAQMRMEDYYAFMAAYGMVNAAFQSLGGIASVAANIKPVLKMADPILKASPEMQENRTLVRSLSGSVELDHVSFRYSEETPLVIDDLSLRIKKGEYLAIVGHTGCGKSTLMRLLLGFEEPSGGAVYYDGKDLKNLDLKSLRRKIGTVIQNGTLLSGDIFSNIAICAPGLTLDEAWEAAEVAGIADDIRRMPMGMYTYISEGQGGISGGQKQRLLIARAIAPKPQILMFDEATSALDNKTQKKIIDALEELHCTRIVIAHRLSTIRHCDRIVVLEGGKIIESGTYEELLEQNGYFAELVKRQITS